MIHAAMQKASADLHEAWYVATARDCRTEDREKVRMDDRPDMYIRICGQRFCPDEDDLEVSGLALPLEEARRMRQDIVGGSFSDLHVTDWPL